MARLEDLKGSNTFEYASYFCNKKRFPAWPLGKSTMKRMSKLIFILCFFSTATFGESVSYLFKGKTIFILDVSVFNSTDEVFLFGFQGAKKEKLSHSFSFPKQFGYHANYLAQKLKVRSPAQLKKFLGRKRRT